MRCTQLRHFGETLLLEFAGMICKERCDFHNTQPEGASSFAASKFKISKQTWHVRKELADAMIVSAAALGF